MRHDFQTLRICKWCGKPLEEIVHLNIKECTGQKNIVHNNYVTALRKLNFFMENICPKLDQTS